MVIFTKKYQVRRISVRNILWGFLLWIAATMIFRFFGHHFLIQGHYILLLVSFLMAIPLIFVVTYPYYHFMKISDSNRMLAAIQIAVPGMILDIFSIIFFPLVFSNLHNDTLSYFSAWLLWAYSLILLTGITLKRK